ncbi:MAG: MmgE/PrpD family protein [Pseudorhodobacter sp.]
MTLLGAILDRLSETGPLPDRAKEVALLHLADAVGVGHAAAGSAIGAPWRRHGQAMATGGAASVFGQQQGARPADAALINGGLIHSLEYDDTHTGSIVHGSAVLAAAALAAGEATGASGAAVLRSYALWYEVMIRLGLAAAGGFQAQGFQFTSVGGALCAAGVVAQLRGLDRAGQMAAVGIALSQASGVFEFLTNGSTVKSMHPGWAAHAGIIAADLAAAGLTGPETAIEGRFGLFRIFADDAAATTRFEAMLADLGQVWHLEQAAFKFHPCCHYLHPFVEAMGLLADGIPNPDEVAFIEFGVPQGAAAIICEPWQEKCRAVGHAARWSLPITVAMRLVDGAITLQSFERPAGPEVLALATKSRWVPLENARFPARFEALIRVGLQGGRVLEQRIDDVYGNASRPAARSDIAAKFDANLAQVANAADADALHHALMSVSMADDLGGVSRSIRAIGGKLHDGN